MYKIKLKNNIFFLQRGRYITSTLIYIYVHDIYIYI